MASPHVRFFMHCRREAQGQNASESERKRLGLVRIYFSISFSSILIFLNVSAILVVAVADCRSKWEIQYLVLLLVASHRRRGFSGLGGLDVYMDGAVRIHGKI